MRQSLRLGRVAGIPVGVHWSVGVIMLLVADILGSSVLPAASRHQAAAVYWTVALFAAAIFAGTLLLHELAHAVVAKRHGIKVRSITLWMLGGVAELEGDPPNPGADLRIALAGPATSAGLAVLLFGLAMGIGHVGGSAVVVAAVTWLALMNGVLAVFNMLPGAPMDGGRVLRALLWRHYGDRVRAALAATRAGRFVGFGLIVLGLAEFLLWANVVGGMWLMIIGWFLESAATAEAAATLASAALAGLRVSDVMTPDPDIAPGWNTIQDFVDRVAAHSRVSAFPVVGFDGHFAGIVVTDQLATVRPQDRAVLRLDQVALAVPPGYLVAPDDPAGSLLGRPPLGGQVAGVVLDQGRVVGLVTTSDVSWAMQRARLRRESGAAPTDQRSGHHVHS